MDKHDGFQLGVIPYLNSFYFTCANYKQVFVKWRDHLTLKDSTEEKLAKTT